MQSRLLIILLLLPVCSCIKNSIFEKETIDSLIIDTKADGGVFSDYQVTSKDIANYITFKSLDGLSRKEKSVVKGVIPIIWQDVPCLYAIEYEKGYEVISADKRSPLPLMKDDEGEFELPTEDSPIGFHLYTLAEDVWLSLYQNESFGEPDKETIDNIESSLLFWKLISADYKIINSKAPKTKSSRDTIILDPNHGHWELIGTATETEVYDTVGHLTSTWWHQWPPFNQYCPYYSVATIIDGRCPAGCVAIAGAQMLYFLHYKIGVPEQSPSTGSCPGYVDTTGWPVQYYTQTFGDYSSATWNKMRSQNDPYHYAAMLIGDIGKKVHMEYNLAPEGSGATLEDLRDSAFVSYGIQCSLLNHYSGSFLRGYLETGYPVLCSGIHQETRTGGNTNGAIGHAFLVDSYIRSREKITFTYEWVFDDPGQSPGYQVLKSTIVYNSPYITMYRMNWGQGYYNNYDDVWCGMNGIWQWGDHTYTHNRQMMYNFRALNE